MDKLTVIVLAKNEEESIKNCLECVKFADEILLIDDNSSDKTVEIAKKFKAKVIHKKLKSFSEQRNLALEKSSNKWVLFLDADESVGEDFQREIEEKITSEKHDGYYIKRKDFFMGKEMKFGDLHNNWLLRLGRKDKGMWEGDVHEIWVIKGNISKLENSIIHNPHKEIKSFIAKLNNYSSIRAKELFNKRRQSSVISIILYPVGKFIKLYILKLGFRDGTHGFVHSVFMSFYSFLVRAKLFHLIINER